MKKLAAFAPAIFFAAHIFAQQDAHLLLEGYLKNNLDLHTLSSQVEKQILSSHATEISNGITIQLSTGEVEFQFGNDSYFTFNPKASVAIPKADNLNLSVSSEVTLDSEQDKNLTDISIAFSLDVYSGAAEERRIALLESERALLEARRALQDGFIKAERDFYSELKSLYTIASQIVNAEKNLYEDKLSFEEIRAQGYSTSSTKYRLAQSEVANDEHKVQIYRHKLERETRVFASKCGVEFSAKTAQEFLPENIDEVKGLDIHSFKKEHYVKIESAVWKNYINGLKRKAKKNMTLSLGAGYTIDKTIRSEYHDTVDALIAYTWDTSAVTAKAGVSFPVDSLSPVYNLGLSIIPHQFALSHIDDGLDRQDILQEEVTIQNAETDFNTLVIDQTLTLSDLEWNRESSKETFDMYNTFEKDMKSYFERGIVTESEYKSAQVNKENYRIEIIISNLDLIIYNDELQLLFTKDGELKK